MTRHLRLISHDLFLHKIHKKFMCFSLVCRLFSYSEKKRNKDHTLEKKTESNLHSIWVLDQFISIVIFLPHNFEQLLLFLDGFL